MSAMKRQSLTVNGAVRALLSRTTAAKSLSYDKSTFHDVLALFKGDCTRKDMTCALENFDGLQVASRKKFKQCPFSCFELLLGCGFWRFRTCTSFGSSSHISNLLFCYPFLHLCYLYVLRYKWCRHHGCFRSHLFKSAHSFRILCERVTLPIMRFWGSNFLRNKPTTVAYQKSDLRELQSAIMEAQ